MERSAIYTMLTAAISRIMSETHRGADVPVDIDPDADLFELGLDSLALIELIPVVEDAIQNEIDFAQEDVDAFFTLRGIADYILSHGKSGESASLDRTGA